MKPKAPMSSDQKARLSAGKLPEPKKPVQPGMNPAPAASKVRKPKKSLKNLAKLFRKPAGAKGTRAKIQG